MTTLFEPLQSRPHAPGQPRGDVRRLREGAEINTPDRLTFYGGGAKGYTDYPVLG